VLPIVRVDGIRHEHFDWTDSITVQSVHEHGVDGRSFITTYRNDGTLPYVDVEVKNVVLDDLRQSPYSARIEFEKVYTNPANHTELKRERWVASVTYVFRENVKNNELAVNPLGLTIVRFRADQAFN
jgi:type IV secretory pathway component VirB8